jgi:hypothetical protein
MNHKVMRLSVSALVAGVVVAFSQSAQSQALYDNGTDSAYNGNFNYNNVSPGDTSPASAGNQIILAGSATSDYISEFIVQFDLINSGASPLTGSPTGDEEVALSFYANNGAGGAPGTMLYCSGFSTMSSIGLNYFSEGQNLTYTPDISVPQEFTWVLTFADIPSTESAGLALRGPPTIGQTFEDAWYNNGTGWTDVTIPGGNPLLEFGAEAIPEPSCLWFVNLAAGAGFWWRSRVSRRPSA